MGLSVARKAGGTFSGASKQWQVECFSTGFVTAWASIAGLELCASCDALHDTL